MTDKERVILAGLTILNRLDEAYTMTHPESRPKNENSLRVMRNRYLGTPEVKTYIGAVRAMIAGSSSPTPQDAPDLTDKDVLIAELTKQYALAGDPAKASQILAKIADIQNLKAEMKASAEEERIHLYLPVTCDICPYAPQNQNQNK